MSPDDRLVRATAEGEEREFERTLRPKRLDEYIGQARIKDTLGWTPRYDDLETIVETSLNWERHLAKHPVT